MHINDIIHNCLGRFKNREFICTKTAYTDPVSKEKLPIFNDISLKTNPASNALVAYGENASGKSLLCKVIEQDLAKNKYPARSVSVKNRTSKGIERAFIFGDEGAQSTGETSIRVIQKALNSAQSDDKGSVLIFDEPDLGLSSKYAKALGTYLAQNADRLKEKGVFVIIVSHNIPLLNAFCVALAEKPSSIGLNTASTLDAWLRDDSEKTIDELLALSKLSRAKESAIDREIDKARRERAN